MGLILSVTAAVSSFLKKGGALSLANLQDQLQGQSPVCGKSFTTAKATLAAVISPQFCMLH
jgi:hypothetical protein